MFAWLKRRTPPSPCPANPGKGIQFTVSFANGERTWTESVHLLHSLSQVLTAGGHAHATGKSWVKLESGMVLQPQMVSLHPLEKGGAQTVTTIEVSLDHRIPPGVFEYQHATGKDSQASVSQGFKNWMDLDLPVFLDALEPKAKRCSCLQFDLPAEETIPARKRRAVLGPVSHLVTQPVEQPAEEEHPFCPCCLFTHLLKEAMPKIGHQEFYAFRLFAMRDADGSAAADCRVNGVDWEVGKAALIKYVKSWPERGVEFRKQYVVVQNLPAATAQA